MNSNSTNVNDNNAAFISSTNVNTRNNITSIMITVVNIVTMLVLSK